jgi:hypothetical protein
LVVGSASATIDAAISTYAAFARCANLLETSVTSAASIVIVVAAQHGQTGYRHEIIDMPHADDTNG